MSHTISGWGWWFIMILEEDIVVVSYNPIIRLARLLNISLEYIVGIYSTVLTVYKGRLNMVPVSETLYWFDLLTLV